MNRRYSAIAVSALAFGAAAFTATEASAQVDPHPESRYATTAGQAEASKRPDQGSGHPSGWWVGYPGTEAKNSVATPRSATDHSAWDDIGAEALQAGASALGGAGVALGGMWLYRRRHQPAT